MSTPDDRLYLIQSSERITRIEPYTHAEREAFLASPMQQDAVIRNYEVIGEAAAKLSDATRQQHGHIAWRQLIGFRNLLIHGYASVSVLRVWEIAEQALPVLKAQIAALLAHTEPTEEDA